MRAGAASAPRLRRRRRAPPLGFTLIELMAVVLIMGLLASLVVTSLRGRAEHELRSEADRLAAELELARERAILTGRPHRVLLDLDRRTRRIEWRPRGEPKAEPERPALSPPPAPAGRFEPVAGSAGWRVALPARVRIAAVEANGELTTEGRFAVVFAPDGSADPVTIHLVTDDGAARVAVSVRPGEEAVAVRDEAVR